MTAALDALYARLVEAFGAERVRRDVVLSPMTTFRVGGAADLLFEPRSSAEIVEARKYAAEAGAPVTMLGGGSNVLVSDDGVRGLVLRPRGGEVRFVDERHVQADAAVTVNGLVRWTITHGAAGLEAWAGTPGTVGGAIFGNAHFDGVLISELVTSVVLADAHGQCRDVPANAMAFGYDTSRLQQSGEALLSATFAVTAGEPAALRETARRSLAYRKRTQPLETPSAGCIFQNPQRERDVVPDGIPWSAGALIDRAGLKGAALGRARVSPVHANFIVNDGGASATDIRQLIERCRMAVREQFGVSLRDEIVYLGEFDVITAH
ncbi:MAG: UDP-N-acetylmuramate dehydrogenase [Acidobacteriaceae bacterium]|nr:UDP-N-acetylmuramate dehydrogenase [Acidobacteriaceae bacterium]